MPDIHSLYFSASASARWISCPMSIPLSFGAEEKKDTTAADEGTMGHHFTEFTLRDRLTAVKMGHDTKSYNVVNYLGKMHAGQRLAEHHIADLQGYVDCIWSLVEQGGRLYVENQVDYSAPLGVDHLKGLLRAFGTADALLFMPNGTLWVIDLKFGRWQVDAERNSQLMLYAMGGYRRLRLIHDPKKFNLVIYQPRTSGRPDDQWNCSWAELNAFIEKAREGAQRVLHAVDLHKGRERIPANYYNPTDKNCQFCKAVKCPARKHTWGR